jgi:alcohol dehydrogenase class IV
MIHMIASHLSEDHTLIYSDISPDPTIGQITRGVHTLDSFRPEIIVAAGGGSTIDAAKAMIYFARHAGVTDTNILFVAIPTTSGTGSEVTPFSVVTDEKKSVKHPLVSDEMKPDVAILNTSLVMSVPPHISADTGMDVLTHALEAVVSTKADDFSDAYAQKAAQITFSCLRISCQGDDGKNTQAKEKMHHAACMAGLAFSHASLGLCHAAAHKIGAAFHIPHGRANAILLPHVIEYNIARAEKTMPFGHAPDLDGTQHTIEKYAMLANSCGIAGATPQIAVQGLIRAITRLMHELDMPLRLRDCGISQEIFLQSLPQIAKDTLEDRCMQTNPRPADEIQVIRLLKKAY